jgi:HisJ family histidinol phosphate phosphatase
MIANYHTHTRWCRHGEGEIEDFIRAGIAAGLEELAITEHVPLPGNPDYSRMYCDEFPAFNRELDRMIGQYRGKIRVRKGFECEYYPDLLDYYGELREKFGYEILLLGHHTSIDRKHDNFVLKTEKQIALYADEVCAGLETGLFTILAHPDVPIYGYHTPDAAFNRAMRQIFKTCAACGIPAEINANGMNSGRGYPCASIWRLARDYQPPCIIGADAHYPKDLACEAVDKCEALARSLSLPLIEKLP